MARYLILESSSSGQNAGSLDNYTVENSLCDVYEVEGSLQEAIARLAEVSDSYSTYNHMLVECIPVNIQRGSIGGDTIVAKSGDVVVTTERR